MLPPMSPPEGESATTTPKEEKERGSFFSKVQQVFFSIAEKVIRQTKKSEGKESIQGRVEQQKVPLSSEQQALLLKEIALLEGIRRELIEKEGEEASCFITRYLDSCLARLREVQVLFSERKKTSEPFLVSPDVLREILALQNGNVVKRIRKELLKKVRKAIYDDLAYIASYQESSVANEGYAPSEIETIVSILLDLLNSAPESEDVFSLYRWKRSLDMFRQGLVSLALMILEKGEDTECLQRDRQENELELRRIAALLRDVLAKKEVWRESSFFSEVKKGESSSIEEQVSSLRRSIELFVSRLMEE